MQIWEGSWKGRDKAHVEKLKIQLSWGPRCWGKRVREEAESRVGPVVWCL